MPRQHRYIYVTYIYVIYELFLCARGHWVLRDELTQPWTFASE
ncbi:hypothetical protein [Candidatus Poriferisodalis sp.]